MTMSSSFFLKGKSRKVLKRKGEKLTKTKKKPNLEVEERDDSSGSDLDLKKFSDKDDSDSDRETAEDKKLRLAKKYLEEIKKEEEKRAELTEVDDSIATRLKKDLLEQQGKLRYIISGKFSSISNIELAYVRCKEHKLTVTCVTLSADGLFLFSGSKCSNIVQWSINEKKKVGSINRLSGKICGAVTSIAITSDSKFLASSDNSNNIQIWNGLSLKHLHTFLGHKDVVRGLAFRKGFHDLYSASDDRTVKVWSLDEMAYIETLFGHQAPITSIDALTKERPITSGGRDSTLHVWKIVEESQLIFNGPLGSCEEVKLIDEDHFVSGHDNGSLCIWSVMKKKPLSSISHAHGFEENGNPCWVTSIATAVNTDVFASGSYDGKVRLWKIEDNFRKFSQIMYIDVEGFVNSIQINPAYNKIFIASGQEHKSGRWWKLKQAKNAICIVNLTFDKELS